MLYGIFKLSKIDVKGMKIKMITLSEAKPGKKYFVKQIKDEARLLNRLSSMGVLCGNQLEVCQNNKKQPVLIFSRDTLVAIGREESKKILVGGAKDE